MKKAGLFSVFALALLVVPGGVRADPSNTESDNPYAQLDPEGAPTAASHSQSSLTAGQVEALQKEAAKEERDRNWLMIDYEQKVRDHSQNAAAKNTEPNFYLKLTMDKNLSHLAGLDPLETTEEPDERAPSLHAAPTAKAGNAPSLRPEAPASSGALTPLVGPLSPFSTSATQAFSIPTYSTILPSILTPSPEGVPDGVTPANRTPAPPPEAHSSSYTEVMDLQTPGMVAAKDNSLGETERPDLSLDSLPGGTGDQARAQAAAPAELPQVMDANQLHEEQTVKLKAPAATNGTNTGGTNTASNPAQPQPIPVNPEDAPVPVSQQQQIAPVHPANPSPYDILNR